MRRDLDDLEHDAAVERGERREDYRLVSAAHPCPIPSRCRWDRGTCVTCGKRSGIRPETAMLQMIYRAMSGGMPVAPEELPMAAWIALGELAARERAQLAAIGGMLGGLR